MFVRSLLFACVLLAGVSEPARILSVIPTVSKSHYGFGRRVILELARRGHEVVSVSCFEEKDAPPSFHWVPIDVKHLGEATSSTFDPVAHGQGSFLQQQKALWDMMNSYVNHMTRLNTIKNFIDNDSSHFDLVIAEEFLQPLFYMFAFKYKCPLVLMSSFGSAHYISEYVGNPLEVSYIPHEFKTLFDEMTIVDRIRNAVSTFMDVIARKMYVLNFQNGLAKEVFHKLGDLPDLEDLERNVSLVLLNSHYSMSVVRPFVPNVVEIGGVHIEEPKPLPQDLHEVLEAAQQGAILFSLGSLVELSLLPAPVQLNFLNALGRLPQTVLLRWGYGEKPPVSHPNIQVYSWLPQNDILAHPNVIAFVSHGGLLGSQESIYHGVPMLCIPFFGDQPQNCLRAERMGYGIQLRHTAEEDEIYDAITTLTTDSSFINTARDMARRFRDRPMSALDTAMYWVEYVLRFRGADFIKSPKRMMPWYEYYMVDVAVLLMVSVYLSIVILKRTLKVVTKICLSTNKEKKS